MRKSGHLSWLNIVKQIKETNTRAATTAAILAIPYYEINPRKVGKNSKLSAKNISPRVDRKKQILG